MPESDPRVPDQVADAIWAAWRGGYQLTELPAQIRPADPAAGWAAQRALAERAGASYGYKIAATNPAGAAHIGVDGPLPGLLFERFRRESGAVLDTGGMHMRVAEAEFAFLMGRDVPLGATPEQVLEAVAGLYLAIELPDSRFEHFEQVGAPALLADAACAGWFVLGPQVPGWREVDLVHRGTQLWINGALAASGRGGNVLGDPRAALVWLAGQLERFGSRLRAGELVTTGTTTTPPPIGSGDAVRAEFGGLGNLTVSFAR